MICRRLRSRLFGCIIRVWCWSPCAQNLSKNQMTLTCDGVILVSYSISFPRFSPVCPKWEWVYWFKRKTDFDTWVSNYPVPLNSPKRSRRWWLFLPALRFHYAFLNAFLCMALSRSLSLPSSEYFEVFRTLCLVKDVYVGHKLFSHLNKNRVHLLTGGSSCFIH